MLKSLQVKNFTVFAHADLRFSPQLNVIIGANGSGKSHLLKVAYSVLAASAEEGRKANGSPPSKTVMQARLAEKLVAVLRPEALGRLARRRQGQERCELGFAFDTPALNLDFGFTTGSKSGVTIRKAPSQRVSKPPVFLPTRELLTIYPGFVPIYESHYLDFEEDWRDTCLLLGAPALRGPREKQVRELLAPLEEVMGGKVELDKNGRFYLDVPGLGRMEMPLVAEGIRKLAMIARLIATGSLLDKGYLFWDEPEANLNPAIIRSVARTILHLCRGDVQVFVATHSLFLMRELTIQLQDPTHKGIQARFFGLQPGESGVSVEQGDAIDEIGTIAALDEELSQSDRYLGVEG